MLGLAYAQPEPAMVSEAELKLLGALPRKDAIQTHLKRGEWRLDGLVFKGQSDWIVWLNGEQYTPQNHPGGIRIVDVCAGSVQVCLDEDGAPVKTLCLNQCVNLNA